MEAWNQTWNTEAGRQKWLQPDAFVVGLIPRLQAAGVETVLDLGFGVGRHAILLAEHGFDVYGIDASENGRAYAANWAKQTGQTLHLTTGDMAHLPYAEHFFDLILTWNVIYHGLSTDITTTMAEIKRRLKPGGYLLCTLLSTRHYRFGLGNEIEPKTFVIPGDEETNFPHHYFDQAEISRYLPDTDFRMLVCEDVQQSDPNSYHWQILAQRI
ncbi:MAG: class I SAM-dependent methyltransferase [Chloroflexi bacterium]|nr:class I SAM-dependent methyltransferase [Chloroflexota bacterium]